MDENAKAARVEQLPLTVDWPTCIAGDAEVCQGVQVGGWSRCWAHLLPEDLQEALESLGSSDRLDARGTVLSRSLVRLMLAQVRDEESRLTQLKNADFTGAQFLEKASFEDVHFQGRTSFAHATFDDGASFYGTRFGHYTSFHEATFHGLADFEHASFAQVAFKRIEFGPVIFNRAQFTGLTEFMSVHFNYSAEFVGISTNARASFVDCHFDDLCTFQNAKFRGRTDIAGSTFEYGPDLLGATFGEDANFVHNEYTDNAVFVQAKFKGKADFDESTFEGGAWFADTEFSGEARFADVEFGGDVLCQGARFDGKVDFAGSRVAHGMWLESTGSGGELTLYGLQAKGVIEVTGPFAKVSCADAEIQGRVWFRLTGSELWLDDSAFYAPVTVESRLLPPSAGLAGIGPTDGRVRLRSLKGTDAEHLSLVDVDLSRCELAGLRRPELLRMVGRNRFAPVPRGWCLRWGWAPWRWSAREALFEEHIWRRSVNAPAPGTGWESPDPGQEIIVPPDRLAVTYRQLRSVLEDAKNEPGAADLYYGEMEMRRAASQRWGERGLLLAYWLVSGYGLRASRSLVALAGVILAAALAFRYVGFPGVTPSYANCLVYAAGAVLSLDLASRHLPGVLSEWGDVLRIGLRITGPVLLGLAAFAMRGRVKR